MNKDVKRVAGRRRQPLDVVHAPQTGAGRGHCISYLRPRGILRSGVDPRPCPMRGARTRDNGDLAELAQTVWKVASIGFHCGLRRARI